MGRSQYIYIDGSVRNIVYFKSQLVDDINCFKKAHPDIHKLSSIYSGCVYTYLYVYILGKKSKIMHTNSYTWLFLKGSGKGTDCGECVNKKNFQDRTF